MGTEPDEEPLDCGACSGTGIGAFGAPDTSRCSSCGGSGIARSERDDGPNCDFDPDEE